MWRHAHPRVPKCVCDGINLALIALSEAAARKLAIGEGLVTHLTSLVLVDEEGPVQEGLPVTRKVSLPTPRTAGDMVGDIASPKACYSMMPPTDGLDRDTILLSPLPPRGATHDLAPPPSDMPEAEKEEERNRQAENLYLITSWINWEREGRALAACNLSGLEPAVAASIRALANHEDILETAAEWGIESIQLAIALIAAWAVEHNADWDQSAERHADRVRRRLLKGVDSDAFSAYFKQFDPEANWENELGGDLV